MHSGDLVISGLRNLDGVLLFCFKMLSKSIPGRPRARRAAKSSKKLQSRARFRAVRDRESQKCKTYIFLTVLKVWGGSGSSGNQEIMESVTLSAYFDNVLLRFCEIVGIAFPDKISRAQM